MGEYRYHYQVIFDFLISVTASKSTKDCDDVVSISVVDRLCLSHAMEALSIE